jgi:hypothetical protein
VKELPLATGMAIGEVSLYQGVKIKLFDGTTEVTERAAPVVAGRPGLLRVFFAPQPDWQPRPLVVRLTLKSSAGELPVQEIVGQPGGASDESTLISTANFEIDGALLAGDLSYTVSILEADASVTAPGSSDGALVPPAGEAAFHEESAGGPLRIVVVPITYDADGSGRVPDTGDAQLENLRQAMLKMYPAPEVQMAIGAPLAWPAKVSPNGSGWQGLLDAVIKRRTTDKVEKDVYYYGLFTPANSELQFCGGGCVAGLTYISNNSQDASLRTSIGLGYLDPSTLTTMAHEIGHAHGRLHAPCQIPDASSIDKAFPDKGGRLSDWGYDIVAKKLFAPQKTADVMGYCSPVWVSHYTYSSLFKQMKFVHGSAYVLPPAGGQPTHWVTASLDMDGGLTWGEAVSRLAEPDGDPLEVTLLGASGEPLGEAHGYFHGLSHLPGGRLLLPEGTPRAHAVRTRGGATYALRR